MASSSASTSVVLPEPEWPTTTTLRMASGRSTAAAATAAPRSAPLVDPFDAIGRLQLPRWCPRAAIRHPPPFTDKTRAGLPRETLSYPGARPRVPVCAGTAKAGTTMAGLLSRGPFSRSGWGRVFAPLVRWLVKHGVTANTVTVFGTVGAIVGALGFYTRGDFFVGTLIIWVFTMLDSVDGAVARPQGGATVFGAVLDSSLDRIVDAAVFGALLWWFAGDGDARPLQLACLLCLVFGSVVSYIKARAEGAGLTCNVGLVERRRAAGPRRWPGPAWTASASRTRRRSPSGRWSCCRGHRRPTAGRACAGRPAAVQSG